MKISIYAFGAQSDMSIDVPRDSHTAKYLKDIEKQNPGILGDAWVRLVNYFGLATGGVVHPLMIAAALHSESLECDEIADEGEGWSDDINEAADRAVTLKNVAARICALEMARILL